MSSVLTRRALNRAYLDRQMLLRREALTPVEVIERLVGLQAQQARPPFVGLGTRLTSFERGDLIADIESGAVVRGTLMRCTLHLMSRGDFLAFRPVLQPVLTNAMRSILRERADTFDLAAILAEASRLFRQRPRTFTEIRNALIELFPEADERAMGYTVRTHLPLLIVPNEHTWGYRADPLFALAEDRLGEALPEAASPHALVRRYLAAFGPASGADTQAWSGLTNLAPVLNDLRTELVTLRDERKRELLDLRDAPRPPEDTPAPARFVADFDNLVLGHADRTRVISDEHRPVVVTKNALVLPTILVDGFVAGTWKVARSRKTATLTVTGFAPLPAAAKEELAAESRSLLDLLEPDAAEQRIEFS